MSVERHEATFGVLETNVVRRLRPAVPTNPSSPPRRSEVRSRSVSKPSGNRLIKIGNWGAGPASRPACLGDPGTLSGRHCRLTGICVHSTMQAMRAFNLGVGYLENGELDMALLAFSQAVRLDPRMSGGLQRPGGRLRPAGRTGQGLRRLLRGPAPRPRRPRVLQDPRIHLRADGRRAEVAGRLGAGGFAGGAACVRGPSTCPHFFAPGGVISPCAAALPSFASVALARNRQPTR